MQYFISLNTIKKLITEYSFNKVVVAWDGPKNYESRRKVYKNYKIKRANKRLSDEQTESLYSQKVRITTIPRRNFYKTM